MAFRMGAAPFTITEPRRLAVRLDRARTELDAARFFASDDFDGERGEDHERVAADWIAQSESDYADALACLQEFGTERCPNPLCDEPTGKGSGVDGPRVCTDSWHDKENT